MCEGEQLKLFIDNETAYHNVTAFLKGINAFVNGNKIKDEFIIICQKVAYINAASPAETDCETPSCFCAPNVDRKLVVQLHSNVMGVGDDDLGNTLILAFLDSIRSLPIVPGTILLYNSGVKLALIDSKSLEFLKELEFLGAEIILCGTCVNYYNLKEKIGIGRISNMFEIAEKLTSATTIVKP